MFIKISGFYGALVYATACIARVIKMGEDTGAI